MDALELEHVSCGLFRNPLLQHRNQELMQCMDIGACGLEYVLEVLTLKPEAMRA